MALKLMYITNNPKVAAIAQKYGVDRVWIDLETIGKEERQKGMNTVKSNHSLQDITTIKPILTTSELLVRINPINKDTKKEIDAVMNAGADMIMLPMWKNTGEVNQFLEAVNKRCKTTLLLETKEADECLSEVLDLTGIDEVHIGLNDLHLSYGLKHMFELFSNGTVERICNNLKARGIPYGFGGIAKLGSGELPAEKIVMEHYRLGSTRTILSRSFCNTDVLRELFKIEKVFSENIKKLRDYEEYIMENATLEDFKRNFTEIKEIVNEILVTGRGM